MLIKSTLRKHIKSSKNHAKGSNQFSIDNTVVIFFAKTLVDVSFQVQSVTPKSQFFKLAQYYLNGPLENFSSAAFGGLLSKQGLNTAKSSCGTHPATELLLISGTHTGVLSRWGLGSGRSSLVPGLGDALGVVGN